MIYLLVIHGLSGPVTYGVMKIQQWRQWSAAYDEGKQAGLASSSASTVASATAEAQRDAEEKMALPPDRAAILALC